MHDVKMLENTLFSMLELNKNVWLTQAFFQQSWPSPMSSG